eukprot:Gb_27410 [translate_table: standard]
MNSVKGIELWRWIDTSLPQASSVILRDFNMVEFNEDRLGGLNFTTHSAELEVWTHLNIELALQDVTPAGEDKFTCCNRRQLGAERIWRRLDRCYFSSDGLLECPSELLKIHTTATLSDHYPISVTAYLGSSWEPPKNSLFKLNVSHVNDAEFCKGENEFRNWSPNPLEKRAG